mmetsp:Transcript_56407/g.152149  ORF Transcript_56407/g.152149 Transcript_56407/m.152149 type:complete len:526 (+) Transcript_56407:83-1660(+)
MTLDSDFKQSQFETGDASSGACGQLSSGLSDALTTFAAFILYLGPGLTVAFYVVTVGYYENIFQSELYFILMLMVVYGPYPLIATLQANFDAYFDRALSTKFTYTFRLFLGLLLIQATVATWMCLPATFGGVLGIGFALGTSCAIVQTVAHQIICALDPTKLIFAEVGGQFGSVIPFVVITTMGFTPSATQQEFRAFVSPVIFVLVLAAITLLTLQFSGFFHKAHVRLAADLDGDAINGTEEDAQRQVSRQAADTRLFDEPMDCSYRAASRQATPTGPASRETTPVADQLQPALVGPTFSLLTQRPNIPGWVYKWQFAKGATTAVQSFTMALTCFYGNSKFSQYLASVKLLTDFAGRVTSLPMVKSEQFHAGPWHRFLIATVVVRFVLFAMFMYQLWSPVLPSAVFVALWCFYGYTDRMMSTFSDVTCGAFVEMADRRYVSRLTFMFGFGGLVVGLGFAIAVALPMAQHVGETRISRFAFAVVPSARALVAGPGFPGGAGAPSSGDHGAARALRAAAHRFVLGTD